MAATEYIIGLILVAVGAVGSFMIFGKQVRNKVAQITAALGGDQPAFNSSSGADEVKKADEAAKKTIDMSGAGADVKGDGTVVSE
jgi:hypothetical protein